MAWAAQGFESLLHFQCNLVHRIFNIRFHNMLQIVCFRYSVAVVDIGLFTIRLEHTQRFVLLFILFRKLVRRFFAKRRCHCTVNTAADRNQQTLGTRIFNIRLQKINTLAYFLFFINAWFNLQFSDDLLLQTHRSHTPFLN
ncbi:hypothetical protein D3C74_413750 [compost metagenome]